MRTRSTITTWITRVIVHVTLCVHTRMSEFSTDDASRRIHRSVGTGRRARRRDASDAVRSSAIRADSRRELDRAASTGTPTVARRPRVDRDDAVAVPTARWIRGDADGRRRRDGVDASRRGRDSKIRRLARIQRARASGTTRLCGDARRRIRRAREGRADARETTRGGAEKKNKTPTSDAARGRKRPNGEGGRVRRARDDEEIGRGDDGETDERRERERARRATRTATANAAATARGRARRTTKTRAGGAPVGTEKPVPIVIIDNKSDAFATVVEVSFGNYLGELLDTVAALKNLGLDINKGDVQMSGDSTKTSKFYVIDRENGEKVTKSERLEEIRQTILTNMMAFHPEAAEYIQAKAPTRAGGEGVLGKVKKKVQTGIKCAPERYHSKLEIETTDRPGLLVDVVRTLKDLSLCVVSAEVDTIGDKASDIIYVTHKGGPLSPPMEQLVVNSLSYYLSLTEEESY